MNTNYISKILSWQIFRFLIENIFYYVFIKIINIIFIVILWDFNDSYIQSDYFCNSNCNNIEYFMNNCFQYSDFRIDFLKKLLNNRENWAN